MFALVEKSLYVPTLDLWIDSLRPRERGYVSHGHADHARAHETVVTSVDSARICKLRFRDAGVRFETHAFNEPWELGEHRLTLFSAGHVLGSSQLLIEGERGAFVYTGDFKLEPSFSIGPAEVKRCDVVLMECTYGRPQYVFPPRAEIAGAMVEWATRALEDGAVPIFYAYSLGKAQEALAILGRAGLPVTAHGAIATISEAYLEAGVPLPACERYDAERFDGLRVLLWPPSGRSLPKAVRGRSVRTASLTGWSVSRETRAWGGGADTGFPLSDHADFPSLLRYLELAQPKRVLLNHGWKDFAQRLRRLGFDAEYLEANAQLALF
jgi:Cft2 family RNA processing exonuclease